MTYEANNLEVNYEVVPEELSPKERAEKIFNVFWDTSAFLYRSTCLEFSKFHVNSILHLPLIGSGRMQPENLSDLKYWKDVLSELEKM